MKKGIRILFLVLVGILIISSFLVACEQAPNYTDKYVTQENAHTMVENQPISTDITYSISQYNLIRRAYWCAGEFESAG